MSENTSGADQNPHDHIVPEQASSARHKWRGKLFSSEGKAKKNAEVAEKHNQDILDFLHPPGSRDGSKNSLDVPVPRIDTSTAPRWPSPSRTDASKVPEQRRKTPRKPNLHVTFESAAPEIIGEGGDDAELPAIEVSGSRKSFIAQHSPPNNLVQPESERLGHFKTDEPVIAPSNKPTIPTQKNEEPFKRTPLQRKQTGFVDEPIREGFLNDPQGINLKATEYSIPFPSSQEQDSRLNSESSVNQEEITKVDQPTVSRQGFNKGLNRSSPRFEDTSYHHTEDRVDYTKPNLLTLPSLDLSLSFTNSLTPIPSPLAYPNSKNTSTSNHESQPSQPDYFKLPSMEPNDIPASEGLPETTSRPKPESRTFNIRSVAKNLGHDALNEFAMRVHRFHDIFQIGATVSTPLMGTSIAQWTRTSAYWFLRGRSELEVAVRSELRGAQSSHQAETEKEISLELRQAYLDLAKAWWIVDNIIPHHPELKRFGNAGMDALLAILTSCGEKVLAEQLGVHLAIIASMRALAMSMKRNNRLPSTSFEMQRLDSRIFIEPPKLSPEFENILSKRSQLFSLNGSFSTSVIFPIPVGDTKSDFLYSSFFVDLFLVYRRMETEEIHIPCILSVLREKRVWDVKVIIASQDGHVNMVIQNEPCLGLSWNDVYWKVKSHHLAFTLSDIVDASIRFSEKDFKSLWGIHDYTKTVQKGLRCGENEEQLVDIELKSFQYVDHKGLKMFQPDPATNCLLRLFERKRVLSDSAGGRSIHNGHRLIVVTSPSMKTLTSINFDFGMQRPILFTYLRGDNSAPALLLKLQKPSSDSSMELTFHEVKDRGHFHSLIDGTLVHDDEICSQPLLLEGFSITKIPMEKLSSSPSQSFMNALVWQQTRVISSNLKSSPRSHTHTSESLRICIEGEMGSFVDRMNLGPGEIKMSLSVENLTEIRFFRSPQDDTTSSFASNKLIKEEVDTLCSTLECLATSCTIRSFRFPSLTGLHEFQELTTGFSVLFDGFAANFAISRRRMVVPIYKRWEANLARLQVIKYERTIQLVAFFQDFNHGSCMNFAMKGTDVFESLTRSSMFCIRIVDAKFALPKTDQELSKDFICPNLPEYPSEHDDIIIGFETEAERDKFGKTLPAAVSNVSRMASLRR